MIRILDFTTSNFDCLCKNGRLSVNFVMWSTFFQLAIFHRKIVLENKVFRYDLIISSHLNKLSTDNVGNDFDLSPPLVFRTFSNLYSKFLNSYFTAERS